MNTIDLNGLFGFLKSFYEENLTFNKVLGIEMEELAIDRAVVSFKMKDELVGNSHMNILHGGVIAAVLDFTGGVVAQLSVIEQMKESSPAELTQRLVQMGTIDMRVDYIRPGKGESFKATGEVLRLGNKVAVTRTVLHNNEDILIAAATGTYLVG